MEWKDIDSAIRTMGNISQDQELADLLDVSPPAITAWKKGSTPETKTFIRAYDLLGYQWARQALLALFPPEEAKRIIKKNNQITKEWNARKKELDKLFASKEKQNRRNTLTSQ